MSVEICETLDSKLHAIVEGSITDRANIAFFSRRRRSGNSGSTWCHPYITTVYAISLVLPTDIADIV